jgi:cellulose biosynthesis protein BcsQ
MSAPVLTFFNNKGGVGKTSLIYHLAWMFAEAGKRVVAIDLDPQANLTAAFLEEEDIESIWQEGTPGTTIYQCVAPLAGVKDIDPPILLKIAPNLCLLPGDVRLSRFEDTLSNEWPRSMADNNLYRPMRILTAFWQVMQLASRDFSADLILVDIGPNLGAINRSTLLATEYVVIPLGADLYSLKGLQNLGPILNDWRKSWEKRLVNWAGSEESKQYLDFRMPTGKMEPIGYLCQQHGVRLDRPVKAYDKWVQRIPGAYRESVLHEEPIEGLKQQDDPYCIATIKHYRSLVPMGQEARKPIFSLTAADGAIGGHASAVATAKEDFRVLAAKIADKIGMKT